jgi:hypothetical protein
VNITIGIGIYKCTIAHSKAIMLTNLTGQRYHLVLDANPKPYNPDNPWLAEDGNYWIRAIPATGCKAFENGNEPDERQGILRYNASSTDVPVSWRPEFSKTCQDEPYQNLVPVLKWNVPKLKDPCKFKF